MDSELRKQTIFATSRDVCVRVRVWVGGCRIQLRMCAVLSV